MPNETGFLLAELGAVEPASLKPDPAVQTQSGISVVRAGALRGRPKCGGEGDQRRAVSRFEGRCQVAELDDYTGEEDGSRHAHAIHALTVRDSEIAVASHFMDEALFATFGIAATL